MGMMTEYYHYFFTTLVRHSDKFVSITAETAEGFHVLYTTIIDEKCSLTAKYYYYCRSHCLVMELAQYICHKHQAFSHLAHF